MENKMSTGTTVDGKPVQAGDAVTLIGSVSSVASYPTISVVLLQSGLTVTALAKNWGGPTASGVAKVVAGPSVGDQVSSIGASVNSVSGSGATAVLTVQFQETTVSAQARDTYASQSL
jgi:hypothetical protein